LEPAYTLGYRGHFIKIPKKKKQKKTKQKRYISLNDTGRTKEDTTRLYELNLQLILQDD
jgi:hypothetical protein